MRVYSFLYGVCLLLFFRGFPFLLSLRCLTWFGTVTRFCYVAMALMVLLWRLRRRFIRYWFVWFLPWVDSNVSSVRYKKLFLFLRRVPRCDRLGARCGGLYGQNLGKTLSGWDNERWLDISFETAREVVNSRRLVLRGFEKGCPLFLSFYDGVEQHNVGQYRTNTGVLFHRNDQIRFQYRFFYCGAKHIGFGRVVWKWFWSGF